VDSHTLIVLGAQAPEMDMIERIALAAGLPVAYATNGHPAERGAARVTPATAYNATSLAWPDTERALPPPGAWYPRQIIAVECGFPVPGEACSPAELEFWRHGGSADPEVITVRSHPRRWVRSTPIGAVAPRNRMMGT
jgi:hypothetical protein